MKIYTKKGDQGETSLIGGTRVLKSHLRIDSYGTVDELNAYIGLIRDQAIAAHYKAVLKNIQESLFTIGSNLAADPEHTKMRLPEVNAKGIAELEIEIDRMQEELPELKHFILPGGHSIVSFCHVARCVCRRAERLIVRLSGEEKINELIISYMNRLSDYLFVLGRKLAMDLKAEEYKWLPEV
ncbi:cob(I)alamin adenosyltransferase [Anseongella ginsenosidimutans]|uniref:Corrinoid adenosyltransferase n=1 Tax=Anseongella ginsenosidimutans TaxID=496056 RepID=A0A4R3KMH9_9SPHI|nr:cob(I)yrinic acid a,c-diamide adenosyltransferase [Anseongella ginsenosidimutans]QEC52756.1 cob(I)yrinic acid a,c-diamide adenosyltransferase [Anseongella ginsenosidimutans]TCS85513.1 cob(I)alamin adenosyltransferase [Anseongella ginsenosidimutans]